MSHLQFHDASISKATRSFGQILFTNVITRHVAVFKASYVPNGFILVISKKTCCVIFQTRSVGLFGA
jgi:hypothetical protein